MARSIAVIILAILLLLALLPIGAAFSQETDPAFSNDAPAIADSTNAAPPPEEVNCPTPTGDGAHPSPGAATPIMTTIAVDRANIRSGPSIASSVVFQLPRGTRLEVVGQSADWFKVRLPDQREGWVASGWIVTANDVPLTTERIYAGNPRSVALSLADFEPGWSLVHEEGQYPRPASRPSDYLAQFQSQDGALRTIYVAVWDTVADADLNMRALGVGGIPSQSFSRICAPQYGDATLAFSGPDGLVVLHARVSNVVITVGAADLTTSDVLMKRFWIASTRICLSAHNEWAAPHNAEPPG